MSGNRIRIDGTWHNIDNIGDYSLSRVHSIEYKHGHVWQIAFGTTILELTPEQAIQLRAVCRGIDDMFMDKD